MTSTHEEKAVAFFGMWSITGLYLDGWAHIHDKPETFFSPWHGVLYSGVGVAVAYFAVRAFFLRRTTAVEDRLLTLGFLLFVIGAVGDFVWHEVFGIEVGIEALLSPTHLTLLSGGLLMVSFPARAAAERNEGRSARMRIFWPVVLSLTLIVLLVMFFTQYLAAHRFPGLFGDPNSDDPWQMAAIASVFVTHAILLGPMLFAVRRWDTPVGSFMLMYTLLAAGVTGMFEFFAAAHIPAMALAGLGVDLLAARLRPSPERRREALIFGGLASLLTWGLWLAAIHLMEGVRWSVDMWAGVLYLTVLEGIGFALIAFPKPSAVVEVVPGRHAADEPLYSNDQV